MMAPKRTLANRIGLILMLTISPILTAEPAVPPFHASIVPSSKTTSVEVRIPKDAHRKALSTVYLQIENGDSFDLRVPVAFREELSDYIISLTIPNSIAKNAVLSITHEFPITPQPDGSVDLPAAIQAAESYEIPLGKAARPPQAE